MRRQCFLLLAWAAGPAAALQHAGMWGLSNGSAVSGPTEDPASAYTTLTFDVSDPAAIRANAAVGVRALYPITWTTSRKEQCYAPVPHTQTTPDGKFSCLTIDPAYKAKWKAQYAAMKPLIASGAVIGVFLGDEHMYFGVQVAEVKLICDLIKADWPHAIIYENEAPDVAMCNYRKDNTTIWAEGECMPQNLDWFGFDFYSSDSSVWQAPREAYESMVYPRFSRVDQKVVPVTLGYAGASLTARGAAELDEVCRASAAAHLGWALQDPRVVMVAPFHWNGGVKHPNGSISGGTGIFNLPKCASTYIAMGRMVKAALPAGTSGDRAHAPPNPAPMGPEPKCTSPVRAPPDTWAWCSRSLPAAGGSGWTCDPETKQCAKQLVGGRYDTEDECETKCA